MLWPGDLVFFYPHPRGTLPSGTVALALLLLAAITAVAVARRRRRPWLSPGGSGTSARWCRSSGSSRSGGRPWPIATATCRSSASSWRSPGRRAPGAVRRRGATRCSRAVAAALLIILAGLTFRQSGHWKDTQRSRTTCWRSTRATPSPTTCRGWTCCCATSRRGQSRCCGWPLALSPGYHEARYNLGLALAETGETDEALLEFTLARARQAPRRRGPEQPRAAVRRRRGTCRRHSRCSRGLAIDRAGRRRNPRQPRQDARRDGPPRRSRRPLPRRAGARPGRRRSPQQPRRDARRAGPDRRLSDISRRRCASPRATRKPGPTSREPGVNAPPTAEQSHFLLNLSSFSAPRAYFFTSSRL